jgi:hypothetical protein
MLFVINLILNYQHTINTTIDVGNNICRFTTIYKFVSVTREACVKTEQNNSMQLCNKVTLLQSSNEVENRLKNVAK